MQQIVCSSSAGIVKKMICSGRILVPKQLEVIVGSQRTAESDTFWMDIGEKVGNISLVCMEERNYSSH